VDLAEFERFLKQHETDIYSFCRYLAMDNDMADELYQDTVLQALEMVERIDADNNPKSFFFSIAVGKWKNIRRKAGRRHAIAPTVPLADFMEYAEDSDSPERHAHNALLREYIGHALAKMDDKFRIPLILFYYDELSVEAVAKICKVPKGTVKSRLYKGRSLLKESLVKEGFEYD